ncbi:TetR/AcrR family transcriptional regulator [Bacillus sp. ISL-4]|uniref:TetR/AcrR family transcriptional regulator n=1 Tax=Bacillus sp. ISL-4 TaxID=2819125 RepID=UPI001BEB4706|nr:TetR/AcrR family transcriptional regulator [Bacillus sp. ISL-4]MBT2664290.1 TetR/AcrR family transcriptional regulator [Bacillus sp. ISL-4]MBT2669311.1 TetR/AcrR family transcriptional regulator [Streptomyces sp. ISL-14]
MKKNKDTMQLIMDTGQYLVHELGYNAMSYADIAERIGIKKASIHYHFPTKQELVQAILHRYRKEFLNELDQIEQISINSEEKLFRFFQHYRETLANDSKLFLCSIMAAELVSFPIEIQNEINGFFRDNENWIEKVINQGKESGIMDYQISSREQSKIIMAFVQGAQLLARSSGGPSIL